MRFIETWSKFPEEFVTWEFSDYMKEFFVHFPKLATSIDILMLNPTHYFSFVWNFSYKASEENKPVSWRRKNNEQTVVKTKKTKATRKTDSTATAWKIELHSYYGCQCIQS